MPVVLLATRNAGKLREIRELASAGGTGVPGGSGAPAIVWRGLDEFPDLPDAPEEGATFIENARAKALFYALATRLHTLADDSGLEVDALAGRPGIHSARFAGTPRNDHANNRRLLAELAGLPPERRTARFRCVMAFAAPGRILRESAGALEGRILEVPRGANGFGYDPLFWLPDLQRSVAELPAEQKNALSHRGQALRTMLPQIESYFRALGQWPG
jgi:XTP/dITP diphosphohydrolase